MYAITVRFHDTCEVYQNKLFSTYEEADAEMYEIIGSIERGEDESITTGRKNDTVTFYAMDEAPWGEWIPLETMVIEEWTQEEFDEYMKEWNRKQDIKEGTA